MKRGENMKKMKRMVGVASLAVLVGGASTVLAASKGEFSFSFSSNVIGKTEFKLANKSTSCSSTADSYRYGTSDVLSTKYRYKMSLEQQKIFGKSYSGDKSIYADGLKHKIAFNTVDKGTYTVNIGSPDKLSASGVVIKGDGELFQ